MDREKIIKEINNLTEAKKETIEDCIFSSTTESCYDEIATGVLDVFRDAKTENEFNLANSMLISLADYSITREFEGKTQSEIIELINQITDDDQLVALGRTIHDDLDNSDPGEVINGVLETFESCKTDGEFNSSNMMLIAVCGYSISTLLTLK